jgi:hypothetical protein
MFDKMRLLQTQADEPLGKVNQCLNLVLRSCAPTNSRFRTATGSHT